MCRCGRTQNDPICAIRDRPSRTLDVTQIGGYVRASTLDRCHTK
jgi:hypothetical protein